MKYQITDENNFCRIFRLPETFPQGFCFGGGYPVNFQLVDWFSPVPFDLKETTDEFLIKSLTQFLLKKNYMIKGRKYLLISNFGFTMLLTAI